MRTKTYFSAMLGFCHFSSSEHTGYRFGFNGMEKDDEVKGNGNSLDFGARIYDPRIGRWLATDPLFTKYSDLTPYNFAGNNPVIFVDRDGREIIIHYKDEQGNDKAYNYGSGLAVPDNNFVQGVVNSLDQIKAVNPNLETAVNKVASSTNKILNVSQVKDAGDFLFSGIQTNKNTGAVIPIGTSVPLGDIDINEGTIGFNPNQSIEFEVTPGGNKESVSARTSFAHEFGHAFAAFFYTALEITRSRTPDAQYGTESETYATQNFENPVAAYYGEGIRPHHNGSVIQTGSYDSNIPIATTDDQLNQGAEINLKD